MSDIERAWAALDLPGSADMTGVPAPGVAGQDCLLAIDKNGRRYFLCACAQDFRLPEDLETRGLSVDVESFSVGRMAPTHFLAVSCNEQVLDGVLLGLVEDVRRALAQDDRDRPLSVLKVIKAWRWFWGVGQSGLSEERARGLFGELWFLRRWMGAPSSVTVSRWKGAESAIQDFEWEGELVEVKMRTARTGPVTHKISSLDQLASPERGRLWLFSLHAVEDGQSSNSLPSLVNDLRGQLGSDPVALDAFHRKLAEYGYSPAQSLKYSRGYRVQAERLYEVREGFPRLTRSSFPAGLPAGVDDVQYSVDMAACESFLVASSPAESPWS